MKRFIGAIAAISLSLGVADACAQSFSTGAVNQYSTCGLTPDLGSRLEDAKRFRDWYTEAGFHLVTRWENDDVWNTDLRTAPARTWLPAAGVTCRTFTSSRAMVPAKTRPPQPIRIFW